MVLISQQTKYWLKKHRMGIVTSVLLGTVGSYILATSAVVAETDSTIVALSSPTVIAGTLPKLTQMIKRSRSAVVNISVEVDTSGGNSQFDFDQLSSLPRELRDLLKQMPGMPNNKYGFGGRRTKSHGSGFILSSDGYVVTNAHVVEGATKITVSLDNKRRLVGKVVGIDKLSDIALLKVNASDLPSVFLGDSDKLEVGQWVVAIGAPFGLEYTATQGIVSALSRSLPSETYVPFIQTDAAVNPGNSGGPLFDLNGKVIGVNSQIYSRSGGYMGVSFAIPINVVKDVTDQLKSNGKVSRGWLGVGIQGINEGLAKSFGLTKSEGALVTNVIANSPAEQAGFQVGDVIIEFNDKAVKSANDLPLLVGNTPIGKEVPIKVLRAGKENILNATIVKLASENDDAVVLSSTTKGTLGVVIVGLSDSDRDDYKIKQGGVKVQQVLEDSAAEKAGIQAGDIILAVDGEKVTSADKLKLIVQKIVVKKPVAILLMRDGHTLFVAVDLGL